MKYDFVHRIVELARTYVEERNLNHVYDETVFNIIKDAYFIRDQINSIVSETTKISSLALKEASGVYGEFCRNNYPEYIMLCIILDYALEAKEANCVDDYFRNIFIINYLLDYIERWNIL